MRLTWGQLVTSTWWDKASLLGCVDRRQWNYVALIFINQPDFPVIWTPSRVFFKDVWEQLRIITSAEKICWEVFLSKTASLTRNLILKSLKSFLVLSLFETIAEYICNNPFLFSKLWLVETAVHRCFIE